MSLSRALTKLAPDGHTERVLRDVLALFDHHRREWLTESDVQSKTGRSFAEVHTLLPALSEAFVLDFDSDAKKYRFNGDVALNYEINAFLRRVEHHQAHVQTNVARFRERHGC